MTPAERASAVAFALKNCALEDLHPSRGTLRDARAYQDGTLHCDALVTGTCGDIGSAIMARTVRLIERSWPAGGDVRELTAIHRGLFTDVLVEAGRLRSDDMRHCDPIPPVGGHVLSADDRECRFDRSGAALFPAALVETGAMNITTELCEQHNLHSLDRRVFIRALAHVYDELGYLHPFAAGNAMTLRIFASRLAHDAGWDLDWATVTRQRYQHAAYAAYHGDIHPFEDLFAAIQRPANPTRIFLIAGWDQGPAH